MDAMVKRALWSTAGMVVVFTAFAVVTTQVKTVRAGSPWQDDPYDGVVSFTVFLVPALALLIAARVALTRNRVLEPVHRASLVAGALVAATAVTDWIAVVLRADRPLWNGWTPWLIGALAVVTAVTAAAWPVVWRARRRLADGEPPGDWLTDLPLPAKAFIRRHIVAIAALASLAAGLAITTAEAVGERWTSPLLYLTAAAIGTGGFFAFSMAANALLHIAVPPAKRRSRLHRAFRFAVVLGAATLPIAAVLRDEIWPPVDSPERFAVVTFGGGLVAFVLAFLGAFVMKPGDVP
jgi:hypothetical protein